jgi:hypothetical protein
LDLHLPDGAREARPKRSVISKARRLLGHFQLNPASDGRMSIVIAMSGNGGRQRIRPYERARDSARMLAPADHHRLGRALFVWHEAGD